MNICHCPAFLKHIFDIDIYIYFLGGGVFLPCPWAQYHPTSADPFAVDDVDHQHMCAQP